MHSSNQKGFSLVELMAILVILAVGTGLALPSFGQSARKSRFKKDTHEIMARLRGFKLKAISTGTPLSVSYENLQFIITPKGQEPSFADLDIHTDTSLTLAPETLYFSPQGWVRPATLTLSRDNLSQTIKLDPLSGRPYKPQHQSRQTR